MSKRAAPVRPLRVLLIDNYDSYTYNVAHTLAAVNGAPPHVVRNDALDAADTLAALGCGAGDGGGVGPRQYDAVVIGPGPGTPECADDAGVVVELLRRAVDVPILGVCFGHQALGAAHGARVVRAPEPCHGRISPVHHAGTGVFAGLPDGFAAVRYHSLVVDESTLPACLRVTARTAAPGSGSETLIMAMEHTSRPHFGVQFHPESVATEFGEAMFANFCAFACRHLRLTASARGADPRDAWRTASAAPLGSPAGGAPLKRPRQEEEDDAKGSAGAGAGGGSASAPAPGSAPALGPASGGGQSGECCAEDEAHAPAAADVELGQSGTNALRGEAATVAAAAARVAEKRHAGRGAPLRLAWRRLHRALDRCGGSQALYEGLYAGRGGGVGEHTFWLDSSCTAGQRARFSFMGGADGPLWHALHFSLDPPDASEERGDDGGARTEQQQQQQQQQKLKPAIAQQRCDGAPTSSVNGANDRVPGGTLRTVRLSDARAAAGGPQTFVEERTRLEDGMLSHLRLSLSALACAPEDALPFEFSGGFVGHLGYEMRAECGAVLSRRYDVGPDASFAFADRFVAVDHTNGDVYAVAMHRARAAADENECGEGSAHARAAAEVGVSASAWECASADAAARWVESTCRAIESMEPRPAPLPISRKDSSKAPLAAVNVRRSRDEYMADVSACLRKIAAGETYEVCLTTSMEVPTPEHGGAQQLHPLQLYRELRGYNPAPYAAYVHGGRGSTVLCCSSPERFLRIARDGTVEAKPIKGTAARHPDEADDEESRAALQSSEKDRAENLMIVDLLRNDLARVCVPGSVHVPKGKLFDIESFASVHQMVSTVRGALRPDMCAVECTRASFPGGSMTGAPKLRTMDIIDHIERAPRGPYSGALGYFSACGAADLNIVIRTVMLGEDGSTRIGAGGAVVALSDPEEEHEEMLLKARALRCAIKATPAPV